MERHFGLIGRTLKHSFSKGYFTEKFQNLGLSESHLYHLFELSEIIDFKDLVQKYSTSLGGFNVTIPYKQAIIPFLDELDSAAQRIGAINTIKIVEDKSSNNLHENIKLIGYNTDYWGFINSIRNWKAFAEIKPQKALVLGKGGAAKAVIVALNDLGIEVQVVSRNKENDTIIYEEITKELIQDHLLIINSTPLGMYPNVETFPEIPYPFLTENHLLYDLVYNPEETEFLKKGLEYGVKATHSGLLMLHGQADKAWEIWSE